MTDEVLASGLAWGAVEVDVGEPGGLPPDAARVAPPERPGDPVAQPDAPTAVQGRHLPALDGVRGVAVIGVILYHLGYSWASGGYLGVDLFFVLSGFLITSLLLEDWARSGRLRLGAFYGRRARRLLPALCLMLVLVALYVALNGRFGPSGTSAPVDLSGLRHEGLASLFYVANWQLSSPTSRTSPSSPPRPPSPTPGPWPSRSSSTCSGRRSSSGSWCWPRPGGGGSVLPSPRPPASHRRRGWRSSSTPASTPRGCTTAPTPGPSSSSPASPWPCWSRLGVSPARGPDEPCTWRAPSPPPAWPPSGSSGGPRAACRATSCTGGACWPVRSWRRSSSPTSASWTGARWPGRSHGGPSVGSAPSRTASTSTTTRCSSS